MYFLVIAWLVDLISIYTHEKTPLSLRLMPLDSQSPCVEPLQIHFQIHCAHAIDGFVLGGAIAIIAGTQPPVGIVSLSSNDLLNIES